MKKIRYKLLTSHRRCWLIKQWYPRKRLLKAKDFGLSRGFQVYKTYEEAKKKLDAYGKLDVLVKIYVVEVEGYEGDGE
jgi:hypothetical protein